MNTINKKTRLYKLLIAVTALIVFLWPAQITGAAELWQRTGTDLEPNDTAQDDINDVNNVTISGTLTAGNLKTTGCTASGTKAVAFGNSTASGANAAAFGSSIASGPNSVMFGHNSLAQKNCSFGAGAVDSDGIGSVAMGYSGEGGIFKASGDGSVAMGYSYEDASLLSSKKGSIVIGYVVNGADASANGDGAIVLGYSSSDNYTSGGSGSILMGNNNGSTPSSEGKGSVGLGYANGYDIQATKDGSIAMGYANNGVTKATKIGSVAIGNGVAADANNAFALGTGFTNSTADRFAVGFGQKDLEVWSGNAKVNGTLEVTGDIAVPNETKEVFFPGDLDGKKGTYGVHSVTTSGTWRFTFIVPDDFVTMDSLILAGIPDANGSNKSFDFYSDYAAIGESSTNHSESQTKVVSFTINKWLENDVTSLFDNLAAGDIAGLRVTHGGIGTTIHYVGLVLRYKNY